MPNDGVRSSWKGHSPVIRRGPGLAQLGAGADELGEVDRVADALARVVGVARHQSCAASPCGTKRALQARMAKRSVMPAR